MKRYSNSNAQKKHVKPAAFMVICIIVYAIIVMVNLAGCNTVSGIGRDIQEAAAGVGVDRSRKPSRRPVWDF